MEMPVVNKEREASWLLHSPLDNTTLSGADYYRLRVQLVADAGAAIAGVACDQNAIYVQSRGMTRYGQRKVKSIAWFQSYRHVPSTYIS